MMDSRLYSPAHIIAIDLADSRFEAAEQFGADITINHGREMPSSLSASSPAALAQMLPSKPSASLTRLSSPPNSPAPMVTSPTSESTAKPATLHLEELRIRNVTITTGLVDTSSTPTLLSLAQGHQIDAERFVTHHFTLDQFDEAYDVFARAAETGALTVVLTRT